MSTGVGLARHCARLCSLGFVIRLVAVAVVVLAGQAARGAVIEGLAVVSDPRDEWYAAGDDIRVRATFDEAVRVEHGGDLKLRINIGGVERQAALVADQPARQFTFAYRVQDGDEDTDGIQIDAPAFTGGSFFDQDDDTNVNVATTTLAALSGHKVDGIAPEVFGQPRIVSDPGADSTYAVGDVIEIEIDFNDEIRVRANPELVLSIGRNGATPPTGPLSRRATLDRSRPRLLVFRYEVQAGDQDVDGIRIQADALVGGVVEDLRGNPARREFAAAIYAGHQIDTEAPSVVGVAITSEPARGNTYGAGEVIEVQVTFSEIVYICQGGAPRLRLDVGTAQPYVNYVDGAGTTTLAYRYTVRPLDQDDDGISMGPDAMDDPGGCIEDRAGNNYTAGQRRIDPLPAQPNHRVDGNTTNPSATAAAITSSPDDDDGYRIGEIIEAEVSFNVRVFVREPREPDEDAELRLILDIGGHSRYATFVDGSGTDTLLFRYVVQAGDRDEDGISIGVDALVGASVEDEDGTAASRGFPVVRRDRQQTVDAQRPAADGPPEVLSNANANGYGRGQPIIIRVKLTEPVHVTQTDDDRLALVLSIGDRTRQARFVAGSGTNLLEFRYTVRSDDSDSDGFTIGPNALVGAVIEDNAGNSWGQAERRLTPLRANPRNRVDGDLTDDDAPLVGGVAFVMEDGMPFTNRREYRLGESIFIEVTFTEDVYTPGSLPVLEIAIGGNLRNATLTGGGGSETLRFRYVVQGMDEGGVSIGPGELALLGGTIVDGAGNTALRDFEPLAEHLVDGVAPEVEGPLMLDELPDDGMYGLGDPIVVKIRYDEPVYVTGTLQLIISIGENSRRATFIDGSGSKTLWFRYIVQRGDLDNDGISIGPDALVGGTVEDRAGNDWGEVRRRLPPLDANDDHRVNAAGRTETVQERWISSPSPDVGYYRTGEEIEIKVRFSDEVHVTGAPLLTLLVGSTPRTASLADGSGTDTLIFRYVVQAGDYDADGISIGAGPGALSGGTIQDSSGFEADRIFDALPADPAHRVGVASPRVRDVTVMVPDATSPYGLGDRIEVHVDFTDVVHVTGSPTLALTVGSTSRRATFVEGGGTRKLTFRYTVQAGDYGGVSIGAGPASLSGGTIQGGSGVDADRTFPALPANEVRLEVDAVNPQVQSVTITSTPAAAGTYREGEHIEATVQFDGEVRIGRVGGDGLSLTLTVGQYSRLALTTQTVNTSTRELTFRYTVALGDFDADGISIGSSALRVGDGRLEDRVGRPIKEVTIEPLPNQSGHLVGAGVALAVPVNLTVGGPPAVIDLYENILQPRDIPYSGTYQTPTSDATAVATATVSGHRLVITAHAEGAANVLVVADSAAINLAFAVTVEANVVEVAVLQHALAAMGRGILSSAAYTVGTRLESKRRQPLLPTGRGIRVVAGAGMGGAHAYATQESGAVGCVAIGSPSCRARTFAPAFGSGGFDGSGFHQGALDGSRSPWQGTHSRMPRNASFEMPLIGGVSRDTAWALWGSGDFSTFEGEPESSSYEGDLSAAYVGVDARGEGWLAGAAVGRVNAEADYQFTVGERTSKGSLETNLTVINPYVQWSLGERGRMWALVGVGNGEASIKRENRPSPTEPTDLTMRMGVAGLRTEMAQAGNFRFAVRGDVGSLQLETDSGETALHGLAVNVQRARLGIEASYPMVSPEGAEFTPFVDVGGRHDGGDGQTGSGVEVAAGVRASGGSVRFEAKARTLAMHGAEGYSETGASATVVVEPGSNGTGLRLSLTPRWGGADDGMDVFWRKDAGNGLQAFQREMERGWGAAGRVDYGVAGQGRRGGEATLRPFGEVDVAEDNQRVRVGMAYHFQSPSDKPLKLELSSERVKQSAGTEQRVLLTAEGRF